MRAPMKMTMILPVALLALTGLSARSLTQDDLNAIADGCSFPRDSVLVEGNGRVGLYDDPSNRDQTDSAQCVYGQLQQWGVDIVGTSLGADGE